MNVLFLTLLDFSSLSERDIYTDLLREFVRDGNNVYVISPVEKNKNVATYIINDNNVKIIKLRIGNIQKSRNLVEKGWSTIWLENQIINAIKKFLSDVKFDLVLYSTPPITICKAIEFVKQRDNAKTYLMLKDIFPQNAVDLGMLSKSGLRGLVYRYFRNKEKKLYALSDYIGCMSKANVDYIIKHNPEIDSSKIEICPNSIEPVDMSVSTEQREDIRRRYGIPLDKTVFVYGGNLGKPQGIPFLIECLKTAKDTGAFFLIVGDGTEYGLIEQYVKNDKPKHVKLIRRLPKDEYDAMVGSCDVGMLFLDHRFTIPNYPSRLLSYMQAKLPVLAVTDPNTDVGKDIVDGGYGWWCESNDEYAFTTLVNRILSENRIRYGNNGYHYLIKKYDARICYHSMFISSLFV